MMELENKIEELTDVAEVVTSDNGDGIVKTIDLPPMPITDSSGNGKAVAIGVLGGAAAVGLIYGTVKLVKHFRGGKTDEKKKGRFRRRHSKDEDFSEDARTVDVTVVDLDEEMDQD